MTGDALHAAHSKGIAASRTPWHTQVSVPQLTFLEKGKRGTYLGLLVRLS